MNQSSCNRTDVLVAAREEKIKLVEEILKLVEVECEKCGKEIFVQENYIRKKMFCTIGCMDSYCRASRQKC
jgi:DNA-binding protein H-NS